MLFFYADGRLGNQLFQYSFLRHLARKGEHIVCANMDALFETFDVPRPGITHVGGRIANWLARRIIAPYLLRPLARIGLIGEIGQAIDAQGRYLPRLHGHRGLFPVTYVLPHYFQSEQMFPLEKAVSDLRIKQPFLVEAQRTLRRLAPEGTPVFVHVRRGDYKGIPFLGATGIELPATYYLAAADLVRLKVANPVFIILSDAPTEADALLAELEPKVRSGGSMAVDLALMGLCSGGIMANSSFSWWGAALMPHADVVVAPRYWYGWRQRFDSHPGVQPSFATAIDPLGETAPCAA